MKKNCRHCKTYNYIANLNNTYIGSYTRLNHYFFICTLLYGIEAGVNVYRSTHSNNTKVATHPHLPLTHTHFAFYSRLVKFMVYYVRSCVSILLWKYMACDKDDILIGTSNTYTMSHIVHMYPATGGRTMMT